MIPFLTFLMANWRYVLMGALALGLGVQTLRLAWVNEEFTSYKLEEAKAVKKAQDKADALATDLLIAEAKAYEVRTKTITSYIDRIVHVSTPSDRKCDLDPRNVAGSHGVSDIVRGSLPQAPGNNAPAVPGPRTGP